MAEVGCLGCEGAVGALVPGLVEVAGRRGADEGAAGAGRSHGFWVGSGGKGGIVLRGERVGSASSVCLSVRGSGRLFLLWAHEVCNVCARCRRSDWFWLDGFVFPRVQARQWR